ncbi:MAG TPA: RsmE family RNA methyltransferase [Verrucomicrobiae bacterium]|nr:RsmE family RNA methyltransferase [Verrucomicrobiae bacterium]
MRRRFYVDRFDESSASLTGDAAEHLGRVLRAEPGQLYELSDGQRVFLGRIERIAADKRSEPRIEFSLLEPLEASEPAPAIHLLLSIVKFDRFEWALEKATELGVAEIVPLAAARSDKPLLAAAQKRRERWRKILVESAQQSRRLRPPSLREAAAPGDAFAGSAAALKIFLSERSSAPGLREVLARRDAGAPGPASAALAIGPEGGWTEGEISGAHSAGFAEASLGGTILRTETAVIASVSILRFALGDESARG